MGDWQWEIARMLGDMVFNWWCFASFAVWICGRYWPSLDLALLRHVRAELGPFALPGVLLAYVALTAQGESTMQTNISLVTNVFSWWVFRHYIKDDDDRWKRRRKKLADKVAAVGGRLQVVPAGNS